MNKNKNSTRFYSDAHEKSVCKALNAYQQSNSGAGDFYKGDVVNKDASIIIECKCSMTEKNSISLKKEWFEQNKVEAYQMGMENSAVCINFGPDTDNIYCISEKLMKYLVEKLEEDNI